MKKNNQGMSSKSQPQNNSWWHTILLVWLFWLFSSQRITRATSQSFGHCLLLLSFSNFLTEGNSQVLQEPFPAVFELSKLDGRNGFRLPGAIAGDNSGQSVSSAGDFNGDGIDDVIISARSSYNGSVYVVYGSKTPFNTSLSLSNLDGRNGFKIVGNTIGNSVAAAGDFNGDKIDDIILGTTGNATYIIFGSQSRLNASISVDGLDGKNGFKLEGVGGLAAATAGDFNRDQIDDLIIGDGHASPGGKINAGQAYIIFGSKAGFTATLSLSSLNDANSFRLAGINQGDSVGQSVAGVGDINSDGFGDVIMSSYNTIYKLPLIYVVFGGNSRLNATMSLANLDGNNGFSLEPPMGSSFIVGAAGDINHDGYDDVIIGTLYLQSSYVVFGKKSGFNATLLLTDLNGNNGFRITVSNSGQSVSAAGDLNGDGIDDVIIGVPFAGAGESYVVFGSTTQFNSTFSLATLDEGGGCKITGVAVGDWSGDSVARAGDINGDGIGDVVIGARRASPEGKQQAGESYVIFGHNVTRTRANVTAPFAIPQPPQILNNQLSLNEGERKVLTTNNLLAVDAMATNPILIRYFLIRSSLSHIQFNQLIINRTNIEEFSQQEINDQVIEVVHDGEEASPSASFQVSNGKLIGITTNFNIRFFANQPDAPVLKLKEWPIYINQGGVLTVTEDWLTVSDSDAGDPEKLIIKVISSTHGYFRKVGEDVALMEFTYADVKTNHIEFVHDGNKDDPKVKLQAYDGRLSSEEQMLALSIKPISDLGVVAIIIGALCYCVGFGWGLKIIMNRIMKRLEDRDDSEYARQLALTREGSALDITVARVVCEQLKISAVANFKTLEGVKFIEQITEINQVYQRVNGEIIDVESYAEALAQAIKEVLSADADVISKDNSLSFNIADENNRQPLIRQREAIVERCRNIINEKNEEIRTNDAQYIPMKTF